MRDFSLYVISCKIRFAGFGDIQVSLQKLFSSNIPIFSSKSPIFFWLKRFTIDRALTSLSHRPIQSRIWHMRLHFNQNVFRNCFFVKAQNWFKTPLKTGAKCDQIGPNFLFSIIFVLRVDFNEIEICSRSYIEVPVPAPTLPVCRFKCTQRHKN